MQTITPDSIREDVEIKVAYQKVYINKLFGPLIFCGVRVYADAETCDWVIEREVTKKVGEDYVSSWEEIKRFDAQESIDFTE